MAAIEDILIPELTFVEEAEPATPAANRATLFLDTADGILKWKADDGTVYDIGQGLTNPMTTAGDIIIGGASGVPARLATGAANSRLVSDGAGGLSWIVPSTVDVSLGADVTMTTAGTFYDGPSGSFAAGTWLVLWKAFFRVVTGTPAHHEFWVKMWDGSTVYDTSHDDKYINTTYHNMVHGFAVVTLGGTTTLKISATSDVNNQVLVRNDGYSDNATRLVGYKII